MRHGYVGKVKAVSDLTGSGTSKISSPIDKMDKGSSTLETLVFHKEI